MDNEDLTPDTFNQHFSLDRAALDVSRGLKHRSTDRHLIYVIGDEVCIISDISYIEY